MQYIKYVLELIDLYLGFIDEKFSKELLNQNKITKCKSKEIGKMLFDKYGIDIHKIYIKVKQEIEEKKKG